IMAYAGICNQVGIINDLQPHSDPQFHSISIAEILDYSIQDIGNNCPTLTATGNNAPVANAGADYTIPINTPFILTGTGSDPDNDAISYSWEEIDVFGAIGNWNATQTASIPLFRSFTPKTTGIRYFPQISDVVNATTTIGERLPSISRTMKFRLTIRDNKAGGGGTCFDDASVTVNNTGGAFAVTSQNTNGIIWLDGESKTITWNKGSTNTAPFNVVNVAIELSTDGGYTYPITLLASTPNDGTENIVVPVNYTTTARVRVRALGNIFYSINSNNFTIKVNPAPVKWLSVTAQKEKNKTVKILWTVNEIENSYYDVERSIDGNKFEKIVTVAASKEDGNNHSYTAIDIKPITGKNYYRIKQVDKDGHYTFSIIVFVMIEEVNNSFTIYPNPATSNINLYSNANFYKADIQMFDAIGRIVYAQVNKNISKGSIININLSHLPKGVYSIRIQSDNNETIVKKLIQQ
ncbi:MAG: T9SS type A sorting domain-containing protein, partial [Bacteroidetes bacterium]|nr:T9SS type A sorting domain-containing protein [Bacteroidota bacterium]